jgi:hypothetical protein
MRSRVEQVCFVDFDVRCGSRMEEEGRSKFEIARGDIYSRLEVSKVGK